MKPPIIYTQWLLQPTTAFEYLELLTESLNWERRKDAPRSEYWTSTLGKPYTYGRGAGQRTYYSQPTYWPIERVKDILEERLGFRYEGCFLNMYKDGHDHLGWHSDDDPGINHARPIAVVSLGASRVLSMRSRNGADHDAVPLHTGSLLLMGAGMQQDWQHKITRGDREGLGPRISLTFRSLKT